MVSLDKEVQVFNQDTTNQRFANYNLLTTIWRYPSPLEEVNIAVSKGNIADSQVGLRTLVCNKMPTEQIKQTNLDHHLCSVGTAALLNCVACLGTGGLSQKCPGGGSNGKNGL